MLDYSNFLDSSASRPVGVLVFGCDGLEAGTGFATGFATGVNFVGADCTTVWLGNIPRLSSVDFIP